MRISKTSKFHNQMITLLKETSLSCRQIGKMFGCSRTPVYNLQKRYRIIRPINPRIKNPEVACKFCAKSFRPARYKDRPNRGKYCSKECYRQWQMSSENRGINHPNWVDGGKHEKRLNALRHTKKWAKWRESIYKRDSYSCKFCGCNKSLEPHHIYPRRDYPELIFDISNGITLCKKCHVKTIKKEYDYIEKCEALLMHSSAYSRR